MAFFTLAELGALIVLTVSLGYIFMDMVSMHRPKTVEELYKQKIFNKQDFYFAMMDTAPAVVLHELGHKFVAIALGFQSNFHIWAFGLGVAVFLKLISSPFLIIAPGYVSIPANVPVITQGFIAFAGPLVNAILYGIAFFVMKYRKLSRKKFMFWAMTRRINGILTVFNMLPFWVLDGKKVLDAILCAFGWC